MPRLSTRCPYCFGRMGVKTISCDSCGAEVSARFESPRFLRLSAEQQRFAIDFLLSGGSLKNVAEKYNVSYPTVRARLDRIIETLKGEAEGEQDRRDAILDAVEEKRITSQEAAGLLGGDSELTRSEGDE